MVGAVVDVQVAARSGRRVGGRVGDRAAQAGALEDALDHRPVTCRRVDGTLVAVVGLQVEEHDRLAVRVGVDRGVLHRRRDVAEQETGLDRAERDVGALAVGVRGGRLAVEPEEPVVARPVRRPGASAG